MMLVPPLITWTLDLENSIHDQSHAIIDILENVTITFHVISSIVNNYPMLILLGGVEIHIRHLMNEIQH